MSNEMGWNYRPQTNPLNTWLLEKVLDTQDGWPFTSEEIAVTRTLANDGNPVYTAQISDIPVIMFEQHLWKSDVTSNVSPGAIILRVQFIGITIHNNVSLTNDTYTWRSYPSFATAPDGQPALQMAIPIGEDFPVKWARAQVMVSMGLLYERAEFLLKSWKGRPVKSAAKKEIDWTGARNVAGVVGSLLGGLLKG